MLSNSHVTLNLELKSYIQSLQQEKVIRLHQRHELAELFGFETRNKYSLENEQGFQVGFAAEQSKGLLAMLARYFFGHWRTFEIHLFGADRKLKWIATHPFRFFFQRLEIRTPEGQSLGALQQRFAILSKKFDIEGPDGQVRMTMRSPLWKIWTFPIKRASWAGPVAPGPGADVEVARIEKKWTGFLAEGLTDKDRFRITLTDALEEVEVVLIVSAALFVDLQYFERKARS